MNINFPNINIIILRIPLHVYETLHDSVIDSNLFNQNQC